jgi:hypothetical protein
MSDSVKRFITLDPQEKGERKVLKGKKQKNKNKAEPTWDWEGEESKQMKQKKNV